MLSTASDSMYTRGTTPKMSEQHRLDHTRGRRPAYAMDLVETVLDTPEKSKGEWGEAFG